MEFKHISFEVSNGIATLMLNHPPLNVLTIEMMGEINFALAELAADLEARVLLIRGAGKCFSAGMDVAEHLPEKVERMLAVMQRLFEHLGSIEIPTISAVHGSALGGGFELAAFTDLTLASRTAQFGLPEIKLGVFPPLAVAHFHRLIGTKLARDLILTGRTISADDAWQMGLVNAVFSDEEFSARTAATAKDLSRYSRPALVATKKALKEADGRPLFQALSRAERIYLDELMQSEDAVEGLMAFLEKRSPRWKNR